MDVSKRLGCEGAQGGCLPVMLNSACRCVDERPKASRLETEGGCAGRSVLLNRFNPGKAKMVVKVDKRAASIEKCIVKMRSM